MIEVFKTNVNCRSDANKLIEQIHARYTDCKATFDLEDCDKILRVKRTVGIVHSAGVIHLVKINGFNAEVLQDELQLSPAYLFYIR
jgi:hypothetical protein